MYEMSPRPKPVRKFFANDRLIALQNDLKPAVKGVSQATSGSDPVILAAPNFEKRTCPECGKTVKFNLDDSRYYSHNLPADTRVCPISGRFQPLSANDD